MSKILVSPMVVRPTTRYRWECWFQGRLLWATEFDNLVTTVGKNKLLDMGFVTGSGGTPTWYVGLKGSGAPSSTDTMSSHAGWATLTPYSNSTDPAFTGATPGGGITDNSAAKATFNCNADADIFGCFMKNDATKGGTTGTLYGVGDATSSQHVINGSTLNVTVTLQLA